MLDFKIPGRRPRIAGNRQDPDFKMEPTMSVAVFALADASISDAKPADSTKKPPPKRTATALADRALVPEPR
jgi:hypothetical protein